MDALQRVGDELYHFHKNTKATSGNRRGNDAKVLSMGVLRLVIEGLWSSASMLSSCGILLTLCFPGTTIAVVK